MLADIILIVLLTSFTTSSCSQTEETSKPRHKPPPLHIPRNTNPSIFTFSPSSTSSYSPSPAPFTPSFLNSLTDPHNSTPRSPNQATSRAQLSQPQTTPSISRRQRSVTSASSNSRQTTPSTPSTAPPPQHLHFDTDRSHPYHQVQNVPEHHLVSTSAAVKSW